tara:strand:+ start:2096 stop:2989 length:894 start_codon:yes stop_codon:yes gene_type:complete
MVNTIVLKSSNITDTTKNSTFKYEFPNSINFKDMELGLISASLYYSWFNISDELGNRTFSYLLWENSASGGADFIQNFITLDEGLYEIGDLNKALQFAFIEKGFYLVDTNGDNVYFAEFIVNSVKNSVDIVTYSVPTTLPSGYTAPSTWDYFYSVQTYYPLFILPTTSTFNEIIGYNTGMVTAQTFGDTAFTPRTANSITAPNVNPNSSVLVEVNIVDNPYGVPANIIYAIVPNVGVGSLIYVAPPEYAFVPIRDGVYNGLTLRLLNKDTLEPLTIQDSQITIILGIKEKYENTVKR